MVCIRVCGVPCAPPHPPLLASRCCVVEREANGDNDARMCRHRQTESYRAARSRGDACAAQHTQRESARSTGVIQGSVGIAQREGNGERTREGYKRVIHYHHPPPPLLSAFLPSRQHRAAPRTRMLHRRSHKEVQRPKQALILKSSTRRPLAPIRL